MTDRDRILGLLEEIHSLVEENGNADGTLRFDALRAMVALDFAKTEIEKMVSGQFRKSQHIFAKKIKKFQTQAAKAVEKTASADRKPRISRG